MAVSSGFFDSVNHDRLYNADQVSSMFDGIIIDGVYENFGEAFAVNEYLDAENTVIIGTGRAWFDHTWTLNDSQYALTLDPPSDSLSRIDAIVIDVNKELDTRDNTIKLIKGTEVLSSEEPSKPSLIKSDLHNQYPIAYITRNAGAESIIHQANIEYMVGTSECPMVTGYLEAINIEQIYKQLKDDFYLWWDGVKLGDPDMATHLQEQIDELYEAVLGIDSTTGLLNKRVYDSFVKNDYGLNITSGNISNTSNGGTTFKSNRDFAFFDMNGNAIKPILSIESGKEIQDRKIYIRYNIVKPDGTSTRYGSQTTIMINDGNSYLYQDGIVEAMTTIVDYNIDDYPIKITYYCVVRGGNSRYGEWEGNGALFSVFSTLSEDGVVTLTTSSALVAYIHSCMYNYALYPDNTGLYTSYRSSQTYKNPGEDVVYGYTHQHYTFKMSVDGIPSLLNQKYITTYTDEDPYYYSTPGPVGVLSYNNAIGKMCCFSNSDPVKKWTFEADGSFNMISENASSEEIPPNSYINAIDAFSYSLADGAVNKKSSLRGSANTSYENTKDRPYYIGASNLSEPLPTGDYVCLVDDYQSMYGRITDGTNIAIGANGGAAILKTKNPLGSSFDFTKVIKWVKGYYNNNNNSAGYITTSNTKFGYKANSLAVFTTAYFYIFREE